MFNSSMKNDDDRCWRTLLQRNIEALQSIFRLWTVPQSIKGIIFIRCLFIVLLLFFFPYFWRLISFDLRLNWTYGRKIQFESTLFSFDSGMINILNQRDRWRSEKRKGFSAANDP